MVYGSKVHHLFRIIVYYPSILLREENRRAQVRQQLGDSGRFLFDLPDHL